MSSSATEIKRQDFFSTPIWSTNLSKNNRKERQVSVNDDMITFIRNEIEKNMTQPEDAINNALLEFNNGSNDPPKSEELLQLPSDRNQEGT